MTRTRILLCALTVASLSVFRTAAAQEDTAPAPTPTPAPATTEAPVMTPEPTPTPMEAATPMATPMEAATPTATPMATPMATPVATPPPVVVVKESRAHEGRGKGGNARENVIFVNPFYFILRSVNGGFERMVSPNATVAIGGTLIDYRGLNVSGEENADLRGYGVYLQPHFYFGRRGAPRGPYIAPFVSGDRLEYHFDTREDVAAIRYGVGSTVGWSWLLWNRLNIKLGLGGGFYRASTTENAQVTEEGEGFAPTGDVKVGWAF